MKKFTEFNILYVAWVVAFVSFLGSLFFSEFLHLLPCVLCWYQRIMMYPLVILFAIAIVNGDKKVYQYVLPLSILGLLIAFYHNLLYYGIIPETISPCIIGQSCTEHQLDLFGFIGIPLLSFVSFGIITICTYIFFQANKGNKK